MGPHTSKECSTSAFLFYSKINQIHLLSWLEICIVGNYLLTLAFNVVLLMNNNYDISKDVSFNLVIHSQWPQRQCIATENSLTQFDMLSSHPGLFDLSVSFPDVVHQNKDKRGCAYLK